LELINQKAYTIIGKIESINTGPHFANMTVLTYDKEHINIKMTPEQISLVKLGSIYQFKTICGVKKEEELVLNLESLEPLEKILKADDLAEALSHFYECAPIPVLEIKEGIESYINKIENKILKEIVTEIYQQNIKAFYIHPAATKFHHAYYGGLSYHTFTMLKLIDPFISVYPYLDRNILYAATILHDMSKIAEISGVDGEYTTEGLLIGHLVMQTLEIEKVATKLGYDQTEEVKLLKHMILSHHGQLHYGSPKKPQTGEALLLWFIDTIDSKFTVLGEVLENTREGQFTQMVSVLDKMRFYKPKK